MVAPARTILVVDDEPDLLAILRFTLESKGYEVLTASTPVEAKSKLQSFTVGVLVTDLKMPHGSGLEVVQHARAMHPGVGIVLMSGYSDMKEEEIRAHGALGLLSKPFDHSELLKLIEDHWKGLGS